MKIFRVKFEVSIVWVAIQSSCYLMTIIALLLTIRHTIDALWCAIMLALGVMGWWVCIIWGLKNEQRLQDIEPAELVEKMTDEQYKYVASEVMSQVEKLTGLKLKGRGIDARSKKE